MIRELFLGGGGEMKIRSSEVREKWSFSADFETREKSVGRLVLFTWKSFPGRVGGTVCCAAAAAVRKFTWLKPAKSVCLPLSRCVLSSFRIRNFCCISSSGLHLLDFQLQDVQLSVAVHGKWCTGLLVGSMKFLILHFLLGL